MFNPMQFMAYMMQHHPGADVPSAPVQPPVGQCFTPMQNEPTKAPTPFPAPFTMPLAFKNGLPASMKQPKDSDSNASSDLQKSMSAQPKVDKAMNPSDVECRFGQGCLRSNCWFRHSAGRFIDARMPVTYDRPRSRSPIRGATDVQDDGHQPSVPHPDSDSDSSCPPNKNRSHPHVTSGNLVPLKPVGKLDSSIYQKARDSVPVWPTVLNSKGKLKDFKYNGCGWAVHFCNPDRPRSPISLHDVEGVCAFLQSKQLLVLNAPKVTAMGVIQMTIGYAKGQGNIQIYTTKLGRSTGNARINIGSQDCLKSVRASILVSAWFHDALETGSGPYGGKMQPIFQPEGKMILPPISDQTPIPDLKSVLSAIHKKLGKAGKDGMKKYLAKAGLDQHSDVMLLLKEIFIDKKSKHSKAAPDHDDDNN
eukprot:Skav230494  [mRNA]  locus=scaffold2389:116918:118177:- [translate_table: standard]